MDVQPEERTPLIKQPEDEEQGKEPAPRATRHIQRSVTVEPVLLLYFLAFAPSVPLFQQYVYLRLSESHNFSLPTNSSEKCHLDPNSTEFKQEALVQSEATRCGIYFFLAALLPTTVLTILLGPYTDRRGRKIAMYLPLIGVVLRLTLAAVVVKLHWPIWWLVIAYVVEGFSGGIINILMSCFAYIADVTNVQQRAVRIYILEISCGIGLGVSNIGMGYAIKSFGYFYCVIILLGIHVLNLLYTLFGVQESIIKENNVPFFTLAHVVKAVKLFTTDNATKRRWKLNMCLLMMLLIVAIDAGNFDVQTYKLLKTPLCFTSVLVGYFTAACYFVKMSFGAIFIKFIFPYLEEIRMTIVSCISSTAFNFVFPFAKTILFAFLCEQFFLHYFSRDTVVKTACLCLAVLVDHCVSTSSCNDVRKG